MNHDMIFSIGAGAILGIIGYFLKDIRSSIREQQKSNQEEIKVLRADLEELRAELLQEDEVSREVCRRLVRRAHHEPCADRVAERAQIAKTLHAVFEAHVRRVEFLIVLLRGGLVPQQVPVRTGFLQGRVALVRPLA